MQIGSSSNNIKFLCLMKNHHSIICGTSLTLRESSTTCAPNAKRHSGTRSLSTCSIVSSASVGTRNGAVQLSTQIRGMLSSTHGMQNRLTITVMLAWTNSPKRRKWSSHGTKNGQEFTPLKKPLRLNSASSENFNHKKTKHYGFPFI